MYSTLRLTFLSLVLKGYLSKAGRCEYSVGGGHTSYKYGFEHIGECPGGGVKDDNFFFDL